MTRRGNPRRSPAGLLVALALVAVVAATGAIWTNAFGVGDRFDHLVTRVRLAVNPPPQRSISPVVEVTDPPSGPGSSEEPGQSLEPGATPDPNATPAPTLTLPPGVTPGPTGTPLPPRVAVDVQLPARPGKDFIAEVRDTWCAVAGTQIILAIDGIADNSEGFQRNLAARVGEFESRADSHNGGWGPSAIASALTGYGVPGYEVRAYQTRKTALRDAAVALSRTHAPVVMMSWRGAHTWIITGYRADADPTIFRDANVTGLYIYDPWYGWISKIWEPALAPGEFHDLPNLERNYLQWNRPEGNYPDRDGKFLMVVPTLPRPNL